MAHSSWPSVLCFCFVVPALPKSALRFEPLNLKLEHAITSNTFEFNISILHPTGSGPRFLLTLKEPGKDAPAWLYKKAVESIRKAGYKKELHLDRTGCVLKKPPPEEEKVLYVDVEEKPSP